MRKSIVLCSLYYVWVDVVKQFTFAVSSPDELLVDNVNSHSGALKKNALKVHLCWPFTSVGPFISMAPLPSLDQGLFAFVRPLIEECASSVDVFFMSSG